MERYCGDLKSALKSKRFPWANLANRVLNKAYLEQVELRYELLEGTSENEVLSQGEKIYDGCMCYVACRPFIFAHTCIDPLSILRVPYRKHHAPTPDILRKLISYFHSVTGIPKNRIKQSLPEVMPTWGKVRIANGGDSIRCASSTRSEELERNSSYVRVCLCLYQMKVF